MRDVREIDCRLNFGRQQGAALLLLAPWGQDAVDECEVTDACDCCCCSLELFLLLLLLQLELLLLQLGAVSIKHEQRIEN